MRPAQILDMQADLLDRLDDTLFREVARQSFALDWGAAGGPAEQVRRVGEDLTEALHRHVANAYAYRVTEDMSALVQHAAAGLDETDMFNSLLPPTEHGIVRFDRPLPIIDVRGKTLKAHWLIWGRTPFRRGSTSYPAGMLMVWFNDSHDPDDAEEHVNQSVAPVLGRWRWVGADLAYTGKPLGGVYTALSESQAEAVRAEGDVPTPASNAVRYAHALWLLLGQTITSVTEEPVDRAAARRAGRKNLPPRVSVIALRRTEDAARAEGESHVEWKHRWMVRRYWRWQRYGPVRSDHEHHYGMPDADGFGHMVQRCLHEGCENHLTRILVREHVKGPEDRPLVITEKVYDLRQ